VADLLFKSPQTGSTDLVFGADEVVVGTAINVSLGGALPPLEFAAEVGPVLSLSLVGTLPAMTVALAVNYFSNAARPTVGQVKGPWQIAAHASQNVEHARQGTTTSPAAWIARWQDAARTPAGVEHLLPSGFDRTNRPDITGAFQAATGLHASAQFAHQDALRTRLGLVGLFKNGTGARDDTLFKHQDGTRTHGRRETSQQQATPLPLARFPDRHQVASALLRAWQTAFQDGVPPPPGLSVLPVVGPPLPQPCYFPNTALLFEALAATNGNLVFRCDAGLGPVDPELPPGATLFILPARFYMAVHTLSAQRLPDLAPVPIFDVSLSADAGSFAWTFSASAPASVFEQLAPTAGLPAQIRITLDGMPFVFVVDSLQREEKFGQRGVRIGGRSATALLARPYSREASRLSTTERTAQQLAQDALEFTGATLDWGIEDWLIPAGAYSHLGTPLAAVQAIVEAAGGYLQSHRSAAQLLARHPYPTLPGGIPGGPWNWGGAFAADVQLAPDALITQSIERRDGPDINAVYVSGTTQGVIALVKRTGTAADKLAALVVDPLITATEAAQQRGLSVLGAGGPKHLVSLSLPVLTGPGQPGVLDVGQLVQVNAAQPWRGRVRSVSVNAKMPTARQTVALERHLETTP
jgi:hypothetical protein